MKSKTEKLVAYYLKYPQATAYEAARNAKCSLALARKVLAKRQTPVEVLTEKSVWKLVEPQAGVKYDTGKLPWHLLPPDALDEVLKVLDYGQNKYSARNWEHGMDWSRPFSALMRHMWAWWRGEKNDTETGFSHLAHAACCILFLLTYEIRSKGTDDRPEAS